MSTPWREDPLLAGRFHPQFPDYLQVIVHDGEPRRTKRAPESCWVCVEAVHGTLRSPVAAANAKFPFASASIQWLDRCVYRGKLLNVPTQLNTVQEGSTLLFLHAPGIPNPLAVTEAYLKERPQWAFQPCSACGSDQGFDPPTVMARTRFPDAPTGSVPITFTAFCVCGGRMVLGLVEGAPTAPAPPAQDSSAVLVEAVAQAVLSRGVAWSQKGDVEKAVADYTHVVEGLPGAPVEQVAKALVWRGVMWGQKGDFEKELADYTRVAEGLPGAPVEQVARALFNRGVMWGEKGDVEKAVADYTRVAERLPNAPVEQVAKALLNRGIMRGLKGDVARELADYTRVAEGLPNASVEQVAGALLSRGVTWGQKGDVEKAVADYTRVAEGLLGAPVKLVAKALVNRGVTWGQKGNVEKAIADS